MLHIATPLERLPGVKSGVNSILLRVWSYKSVVTLIPEGRILSHRLIKGLREFSLVLQMVPAIKTDIACKLDNIARVG